MSSKSKSVFIGRSWTLNVDNGESRGQTNKEVRGYATEAVSAYTHQFVFNDGKVVELNDIPGTRPGGDSYAPQYVKSKVAGMMRRLQSQQR